ncbi:DUF547 domain-containing protein [Usitatibacter palustris]|uniref:DUF547 domain-containing protein n=1 Tax=Usitatibacter palustris TaxID=2732487 RepID=A0A6M4HBM8_9PROT|nr:DUF547 domain-containing protein [Usitatibacter palustris]QJR16642.1 hypothetical protein DSM104440_03477 [Usitatibacter palustris]
MSAMRWLVAVLALAATGAWAEVDHSHKAWDDLLKKHVKYVQNGNASRVDYAGFAKDRAAFKAVTDSYSKVTRAEFDAWTKPQQQAFLINAYNAFTIEKILTRYPNIKSIRDFGTVFGNPWKDKFFTLFGQPAYLDQVEHEILRKEGVYDEPRVHVAVVCASIGCPMLANDAFTAEKLDAQLEAGMRRFLSDRTRNRYSAATGKLELSKIFDWYGKDFEKGHRGYTSVKATAAKYADLLADKPEERAIVREQKADVAFLEYDWSLNDVK